MTKDEIVTLIHQVFNITLFKVNETPVTVVSLFVFFFILIVVIVLSKFVTRVLRFRVLSRLHIDESISYTLERTTYYAMIIIGAIIAFQFIGINLSGLAVIFGLLSVGIGFGLQNITSNFISGLILLFERPIRVGDRITVGGTEGDVIAINMRSTTILSLNNIAIIVPNSEFIEGRVTNWSYGDKKVRLDVAVGVSYHSDLDSVLRCLNEVAREHGEILENPEPVVYLMGFGDSSWEMQLRCWIADPKVHYAIRSDLNCAIVRKFRQNNVEIPFPQRDLHLRSSVSLPIEKPV
ncbi:MAG: mechanosensitive ion channel family protein [Candidatus Abyssobacteria bacterium SURF_17]|jgi:small-conductance mechanosensitive channel|uniref:Mechanosensitive ion channel family protein n=1 Tax=Candidatus Abyssobacteria bacterium SURF_17 TaxID=2093361 RepID=A0A419ET56_9BACT|nr:MAG: mechanosensitive ion channel family protein [Candidatus Abyssubacteria bacterium SURF_17]